MLTSILDAKKIPGGLEYEIEVCKNKEKGIAIAKIYGPNAKKMCRILRIYGYGRLLLENILTWITAMLLL